MQERAPSKNLTETEVEQRNQKLREIEFEIFRENTSSYFFLTETEVEQRKVKIARN